MERSRITLIAWMIAASFALSFMNPAWAQPQGTNYDAGAGGGVSIQGVTSFGGFSPLVKGGAGLVVDAQDYTVHLNSIRGNSNQQDVILTHMNPDGTVNWNFQFLRPGQDLDPGAVCEIDQGDGFGFVVFDRQNVISYVVAVDPGGNLVWVTEIKQVIAKDVFWVQDGAGGGNELVVVGEVQNQAYVGHFEISSGNPTYEYVLQNPNGGAVNIGYCGTRHDYFGNMFYNVVTTDFQNHLYVHSFTEDGTYQYTIENDYLNTQRICPYRIRVLEPTQELLIVGTARGFGNGNYYAFLAKAGPDGDIQWTNFLSIGMSGTRSVFEDVVWNPRTERIVTVGFVTDPANGNRNSILINWKYDRNQESWNYYFPTSSSLPGNDDIFGGVDILNNTDLMSVGGFVFEPQVSNDGLADVFVTDDKGGAPCFTDLGSPWDGLNSNRNQINFTPIQVQLANPEDIKEFSFNLHELPCGTPKRRGALALDPQRELNIYPQPALNYLQVEVTGDQLQEARIYGMDGRIVLDRSFGNGVNTTELDLTTLAPGIYLLEARGAQQVWKEKIVVQ